MNFINTGCPLCYGKGYMFAWNLQKKGVTKACKCWKKVLRRREAEKQGLAEEEETDTRLDRLEKDPQIREAYEWLQKNDIGSESIKLSEGVVVSDPVLFRQNLLRLLENPDAPSRNRMYENLLAVYSKAAFTEEDF